MPLKHLIKENCELLIKSPLTPEPINWLNKVVEKKVNHFHQSIPGYQMTPLIELEGLAKTIQIQNIFIKDESYRFGLKAFKSLGGSYAIAKILAKTLNIEPNKLSFETLVSDEIQNKLKDITFITATDGNHGKGVAWFANKIGCKSVIVLPQNPARARVDAIKEQGAEIILTKMNYDDAVRHATLLAEKNGWIIVQDTAWKGYEKIPNWITQGYLTMVNEVFQQEDRAKDISHIFLQAGVGSMAGAVLGAFANHFKEDMPKVIIVEPENAACIFKSALADDGNPRIVDGDHKTIMAGLACGEPNVKTWEILRDYSSGFISCSDEFCCHGMNILAKPVKSDKPIVSGESAAVGPGLLSKIMTDNKFDDIRQHLKLNSQSQVLFFNTEGDTDPVMYKKIIQKKESY